MNTPNINMQFTNTLVKKSLHVHDLQLENADCRRLIFSMHNEYARFPAFDMGGLVSATHYLIYKEYIVWIGSLWTIKVFVNNFDGIERKQKNRKREDRRRKNERQKSKKVTS